MIRRVMRVAVSIWAIRLCLGLLTLSNWLQTVEERIEDWLLQEYYS